MKSQTGDSTQFTFKQFHQHSDLLGSATSIARGAACDTPSFITKKLISLIVVFVLY